MVQQLISPLCGLHLGHEMPAVPFYLLHLADIICCKLSLYNTRECSTHIQTFWQTNFGANFGPPRPIFTLDQIFHDRP